MNAVQYPTGTALRTAIENMLDPEGSWSASTRQIVCTPSFGAYESAAYWTIVLAGSPPKGAIVVQTGWNPGIDDRDRGHPRPFLITSQGKVGKIRFGKNGHDALNALLLLLHQEVPYLKQPCAYVLDKNGTLKPQLCRETSSSVRAE